VTKKEKEIVRETCETISKIISETAFLLEALSKDLSDPEKQELLFETVKANMLDRDPVERKRSQLKLIK